MDGLKGLLKYFPPLLASGFIILSTTFCIDLWYIRAQGPDVNRYQNLQVKTTEQIKDTYSEIEMVHEAIERHKTKDEKLVADIKLLKKKKKSVKQLEEERELLASKLDIEIQSVQALINETKTMQLDLDEIKSNISDLKSTMDNWSTWINILRYLGSFLIGIGVIKLLWTNAEKIENTILSLSKNRELE